MYTQPGPQSSHPYQIALRSYFLALSLSVSPALIPVITSLFSSQPKSPPLLIRLKRRLRHELGHDSFAFAITLSVGGGAILRHAWRKVETSNFSMDDKQPPFRFLPRSIRCYTQSLLHKLNQLSDVWKLFVANAITSLLGILLLQAGYNRRIHSKRARLSILDDLSIPTITATPQGSPTLDLTLLLLVRALDAALQKYIISRVGFRQRVQLTGESRPEQHDSQSDWKERWLRFSTRIDAFVFWTCSARIMWCWFYEPHRLPRSYVKWISSLATVDSRLLRALQLLREGEWSYFHGSSNYPNILTSMSRELNYPPIWGDPLALPARGGPSANAVWRTLGVKNRHNLGGLPCEIVHGGAKGVGGISALAGSCTANATYRSARAFLQAIALYTPVYFLPSILRRPKSLLQSGRVLALVLDTIRSATFLSTFVASYWLAVCTARTLVFARLFSFVSHDFWDGPYGCIMAGCLTCGSSIWIENGKRRGEMALYVLPRAIRACIPQSWISRQSSVALLAERVVFILSLSYLLSSGAYYPETLRGLSRWMLSFILKGPSLTFWKFNDKTTPPLDVTPNATHSESQS